LLSIPIVGFGDATIDKIESYLVKDMKFKVDGEFWQPKDVDGTLLYPIIFNGRSYVPVRALLEDKGVKVDFNNSERTIILDYPVNSGTNSIDDWEVPVGIINDNGEWEPPIGTIDEQGEWVPPSDKYMITDSGMPNRIFMHVIDNTLRYELTFNNKSSLNDLSSDITLDFDLNIDTKMIINEKEISIRDITEDGIAYLLEGGIDGKYTIEADKNTKDIKLISFQGTQIKSTDEINSGVIVSFMKTKHDTAKNSISNVR
jgi:hypothetical protein